MKGKYPVVHVQRRRLSKNNSDTNFGKFRPNQNIGQLLRIDQGLVNPRKDSLVRHEMEQNQLKFGEPGFQTLQRKDSLENLSDMPSSIEMINSSQRSKLLSEQIQYKNIFGMSNTENGGLGIGGTLNKDQECKKFKHSENLCEQKLHWKIKGVNNESLILCNLYAFDESSNEIRLPKIKNESRDILISRNVTESVRNEIAADSQILNRLTSLLDETILCCRNCLCYMLNDKDGSISCCSKGCNPGSEHKHQALDSVPHVHKDQTGKRSFPQGLQVYKQMSRSFENEHFKTGAEEKLKEECEKKTRMCEFCKGCCKNGCISFQDYKEIEANSIPHRYFHKDHVDFVLGNKLLHFYKGEFYYHGEFEGLPQESSIF